MNKDYLIRKKSRNYGKKVLSLIMIGLLAVQNIIVGILPVDAQITAQTIIGEYVKIDLSTLEMITPVVSGGEQAKIAVQIDSKYPITSARLYFSYQSLEPGFSYAQALVYNAQTGKYEAEIEIGPYVKNDIIQVTGITAVDQFNNQTAIRHHDYEIYEHADLRTDFSNETIIIDNPNADVTAPSVDLSTLQVTPLAVSAGEDVTVSIAATDHQSGIESIEFMYDEIGNTLRIWLTDPDGDGIYEGSAHVSEYNLNGMKYLETIRAYDKADNETFLFSEHYFTSQTPTTDLSNGDFEVINGYEPEEPSDITPPSIDLSTLHIEKTTMDGADQNLITLEANDDSGEPLTGCILLASENYTNTYAYFEYNEQQNRYEATIETTRYEKSRDIQVTQLYMSDQTGNTVYYYHPGHHPQEQPKNSLIDYRMYDFSSYTVKIANSQEDITAPVLNLKSLHTKQKKVDGRDAIVITARANDDMSGIESITVHYSNPQQTFMTSVILTHKEAPDKYEGIIFVDEAAVGNHKMEAATIDLLDYAGHRRQYYRNGEVEQPSGPKMLDTPIEYADLSALDFQYDENKVFYQPELIGSDALVIMQGSQFNPLAEIIATDSEDGDLTDQIEIFGSVDTNELGTYTLVYRVTDSDGQSVEKTRLVTVVAATENGVGPEGDVTPEVDAEADTGVGPEGNVTPEVDAEADTGVNPEIDVEAEQGFGPEGNVTPEVDAQADADETKPTLPDAGDYAQATLIFSGITSAIAGAWVTMRRKDK